MEVLLAELKNSAFRLVQVNVQEAIAAVYRFLLAFTPYTKKQER